MACNVHDVLAKAHRALERDRERGREGERERERAREKAGTVFCRQFAARRRGEFLDEKRGVQKLAFIVTCCSESDMDEARATRHAAQ